MSMLNLNIEQLILKLQTIKSEKSYWEYIREIRQRPHLEVFKISTELITSNIENSKIIGIDILAQLGKEPRPLLKETLEIYLNLLKSETAEKTLFSILTAIGHNNKKLTNEELKLICNFKNNKSKMVREGLIFAILNINKELAINTLIELSNDKFSNIRNWATFGIGTQISKSNKNIINALWKRTSDKHLTTRHEALLGLAKRKDTRIKEKLKKELLKMDNYGTLILEAIEELNDLEFVELLNKKILENSDNQIYKITLDALLESQKNNPNSSSFATGM